MNAHFRVGYGYDIHPLVEGRRLVIGGVDIPFEKPINADLTIDVENISPDEISKKIIERLKL